VSELIYFAVPAFVFLLIVEALIAPKRVAAGAIKGYEWRDTATSLSMGLGNVVISLVGKIYALALFLAVGQFALFEISSSSPVAWACLFVAEDCCYYWFHRAHHEIRVLWAAHENHHSSQYFNLSTALRQSWTTPFTGPIFWAPLALLGFSPAMIFTAQAISLLYQFWIHTELIDRMGPFEWIFNTPSHHRVHHGRNPQYLDRNHAGILIVWDRLFATFEPEVEAVDYGLTKNIESFNPLWVATHEFVEIFRSVARSSSWAERLRYVLGRPGWDPDLPSTSESLRPMTLGRER
jgi:sterol desaturase/sphingolipid hydroxylase (fatty acid hydroxylase superfamily)